MTILERFWNMNSLRIRVLTPLIFALILILGSMTLILQQSQQKVLGLELAAKTREAERLFLEYKKEEAKTLSLALSTLTLNKELMAAFKTRDRKRLHDLTKSYFERLRSHYDVTHLYFTGPDRVNILRLHQPDRFGDRIDRFTTLEAEKTGRESQGVELGPLGTFTLRVVTPWYDGEKLLGYVELGMEVEHILKELRKILGSRAFIFIDKDFIQRKGWEAGIRMLGRNEEWGHFPDTVITGEPLGQIPENVAQVIAEKQPLQPATDIHIDGSYFRVVHIPLIDAGKRETGHVSILHDTTARISACHRSVLLISSFYVLVGAALIVFFYAFLGRIEKQQKEQEESRLEFEQGSRIIFDNANDGILLADIETNKFYLGNKMICSMLGYGPEEIKTLGVADIHPEKDLPRVIDHFERMQVGDFSILENMPVKRKDGTVFHADVSARPVTMGGKSYLIGIFRDITERKRAEAALTSATEFSRIMMDSIVDAISIVDVSDYRLIGCNAGFLKKIGLTMDDVVGRRCYELTHHQSEPCCPPFDICPMKETVTTGKYSVAEHIHFLKNGDKFYAEVSTTPVFDGNGKVVSVVHVARDINERKQAEEKIRSLNEELELKVEEKTRELLNAREELVSKEKLSILGQLSGSVGHELRNPLGVMSNAVYFLKMVLADADETTREYLDIIKHEIDNSHRIITDLLDFARTRMPQIKAVTARELTDESLGRCVIPENVDLHTEIPDNLPLLRVDPLQMRQVLVNFITNAVQAMPDGGALRVAVRRVPSSELRVSSSNLNTKTLDPKPDTGVASTSRSMFLVSNSKLKTQNSELDGDFIEISVTDTGEGISPENVKKLFQPLFTTKARGIGLGLVVCKNLVEANGGRIEVESELGKGTSFTVLLPVMWKTGEESAPTKTGAQR